MKGNIKLHDILVALLLVQNRMERRSEVFFQPFKITSAQFNILELLARNEGRMNQLDLVDRLLVGKSSISIVLNRMVRDKLVKREPHPKDRRQVVLALTARGNNLWKKISPRYDAAVERLFSVLPITRRQQFLNDLKLIHHTFFAEDGNPISAADNHWNAYFSNSETSPNTPKSASKEEQSCH